MPTLSDVYQDIAKRHIEAARLLNREGFHEIAIFHCYHAFESVACAALALRGRSIPRNHERKIRSFLSTHRRQPFISGAAVLAETLSSLRNQSLYPGGENEIPRQQFDESEASNLVVRVDGLVRMMARTLFLNGR